jgi:hypothetical protein
MDKRPTSPMCPILQVRLLWGFWSHCELHYGTVVPYDGSSGKVINISYSSYFMSCWSHIFHAKFGPRWSNSFKFCELHVWQNNDIICDRKNKFCSNSSYNIICSSHDREDAGSSPFSHGAAFSSHD